MVQITSNPNKTLSANHLFFNGFQIIDLENIKRVRRMRRQDRPTSMSLACRGGDYSRNLRQCLPGFGRESGGWVDMESIRGHMQLHR